MKKGNVSKVNGSARVVAPWLVVWLLLAGVACDDTAKDPPKDLGPEQQVDVDDTDDEEAAEVAQDVPADAPEEVNITVDQIPIEDEEAGPLCDPEAEDEPDPNFFDANCDGIDGDWNRAIFVAPFGNDGNEGSRARPVRTIQQGIALAVDAGKDVYIQEGVYAGPVEVVSGVNIWGGYGFNWRRSNTASVIIVSGYDASDVARFGGAPAVIAVGITARAVLSHVEVEAQAAIDAGTSAMGLWVEDSPGFEFLHSLVFVGDGAAGLNGAVGAPGLVGGNGVVGTAGCESSTIACSSCNRPRGGNGGTRWCAGSGGRGGDAGHPSDGNAQAGATGSGGAAGGAAASGDLAGGGVGAAGQNGVDGSHGAAGLALGTLREGRWEAPQGGEGEQGGGGAGGGGGGGGGGGTRGCDSWGGGGGGGGSGGCGGYGGFGGGGGGSAIGLVVLGAAPRVEHNDFRIGKGGSGGMGGAGGIGGRGGEGAAGGSGQDDSGRGGAGGAGGRGGLGGWGGGGGGGLSVGILSTEDLSAAASGNTFSLGGGGPGGFSEGERGENGWSVDVLVLEP